MDVVVTLAIDPIFATNQGDVIRKNIDGNVDVGIMATSKEGDNFLPTRTLSRVKGKQVKGTTNEIDFNKDFRDEIDEEIMVSDSKSRRLLIGSCSKVGFEGEVSSQTMNLPLV